MRVDAQTLVRIACAGVVNGRGEAFREVGHPRLDHRTAIFDGEVLVNFAQRTIDMREERLAEVHRVIANSLSSSPSVYEPRMTV